MQLKNPKSKIFFPDNSSLTTALKQTTHLGIGAHQDDLEIMASHGIISCFNSPDQWFSGIVCTDGAGSVKPHGQELLSDLELQQIRIAEQESAARAGNYSSVIQLNYSSHSIKNKGQEKLDFISDLKNIITETTPTYIYTHNLADKHPTHIAVAIATINAIRELPKSLHPKKIYGGEVWKTLDWMVESDKITFNISGNENLIQSLIKLYQSQINSGKHYDSATIGRMQANATYHESHASDSFSHLLYAMDLTPLIDNTSLAIDNYIESYINRFKDETLNNLKTLI